ncbi:MFS transporter [Ferroglobus sp.]|uniref:MFS transporter n=1 Tax=Ferroglobus sp. TaxID=2614230 RepID=UPI00345B7490
MRQLIYLALICFILMFSVTMIYPVVKHYVIDKYKATVSQASLFVAVNLIAYAIFAPVWGSLSDKLGKRKIFITIGLLGNSAMLFLQAVAPNLSLLMLFRFIEGIFTVMVYSIAMTLVLDVARREAYGRGMGVIGMGIATGMAFGAPFGGFLGSLDPVTPFYTASLLIFLAFILALIVLEDVEVVSSKSVLEGIIVAKKRKELLVPYLFSFVDRFTAGFFVSVFPIMLGTLYHMTPKEIGIYLSSFLMPFALLQYPGGFISDRFGRFKPLIFGSFIYGICISSVGFLTPPAIAFSMLVAGVAAAVILPASSALSGDLAPKELKGAAIGGFNFSGSLGFAFGPAVAGFIAEKYGFSQTFYVAGISVFIVTFAAILLLRKWKINEAS